MIEFVAIYWALRDRWSVVFANGASLTGDELRTQADAESAAFELLGVKRDDFSVQAGATADVVRYRPCSWRVSVRSLDEAERERVRECLEWIQFAGVRVGEPVDEQGEEDGGDGARQRHDLRIEQARERWPDVARLIGF